MSSDTPSLRELARDEPDAVRSVAHKAGGRLEQYLLALLEEAER